VGVFVDAPYVWVDQRCERRAAHAARGSGLCSGNLVEYRSGSGRPDVAGAGDGGKDPFRAGGVAVQDEDAPWPLPVVVGWLGIAGTCFRSGPGSRC